MANDVRIQFGVQDRASEALKKISDSTRKMERTIADVARSTKKSARMMEVGLKSVAVAAAALGTLKIAAAGVKAAFQAATQYVDAAEQQAEAARGMTQAQQDFAASLQVATNLGDEATLALMRQAEMMGFTKEQSDDVTLAAAGLAEAMGVSQTTALKMASAAVSGNTKMLQRYIPAVRDAATEEERLAIITETAAAGLNKLQEDAQSTRGAMERSAGAFGDLQEKIGAILSPLYRVIHTGLAIFAETLQTAVGPAIEMASNGFDGAGNAIQGFYRVMQTAAQVVGAAIQTTVAVFRSLFATMFSGFSSAGEAGGGFAETIDNVARFIIRGLTYVEVTLTNLPKIWEMVGAAIALRAETIRADLEQLLTVAIPSYAKWFSDNFVNLATDAFNAYITIAKNWATNIGDIVSRVWEFVSSGFEGGLSGLATDIGAVAGRNLLEGFEAQTEALPDIPARQLTDMEKNLMSMMGKTAVELGSEFQEKFAERTAHLGGSIETPEIEMPDLSQFGVGGNGEGLGIFEPVSNFFKGMFSEAGEAIQSAVEPIQATESRLLSRGTDANPVEQEMLQTQKSGNTLIADGFGQLAGLMGDLLTATEDRTDTNIQVVEG